jgi:hypothetical protein
MSDAVTLVPIDQFLRARAEGAGAPTALTEKAAALRRDFACFSPAAGPPPPLNGGNGRGGSFHHGRGGGGRFRHAHHARPNEPARTDVVKIGSRELSRENLAKKDFLALMNKLSDQNQRTIYQGIKNVFREDFVALYAGLLWDMMQRGADFTPLYMGAHDALVAVSKSPDAWKGEWAARWDAFCAAAAWAPAVHLLEEEDYDEFCDFVKWKKRTLGALRAWVSLAERAWVRADAPSILMDAVTAAFDAEVGRAPIGSKATDAHLEQMLCLIACARPDVAHQCAQWAERHAESAGSWRPSTKFKFWDVREACAGKMKAPVKGRKS